MERGCIEKAFLMFQKEHSKETLPIFVQFTILIFNLTFQEEYILLILTSNRK